MEHPHGKEMRDRLGLFTCSMTRRPCVTSAELGVTMNTTSATIRCRSCSMGIWSNSTSLKCLLRVQG